MWVGIFQIVWTFGGEDRKREGEGGEGMSYDG